MAKRFWNVVLVPEGGGAVRSLRIPHRALHGALGIAILLVVMLAGSIGLHVWALRGLRSLNALRKENASLRTHLSDVNKALEAVEGQVRDGQEMERQARILAGLAVQSGPNRLGTGGPLLTGPGPIAGSTLAGDPVTSALSSPVSSIPPSIAGAAPKAAGPMSGYDHATLDPDLRRTVQLQTARLDTLAQQATRQRASAEETLGLLHRIRERLDHTPSICPIQDPYAVSDGFGYRSDPFTGERAFHSGVDLRAEPGTSVHAAAAGRVVSVGWAGDFGICVRISHGYGYETAYCHLHSARVTEGQTVNRGAVIGTVGTTGRSTGPHLHYEVYVNGVAKNPEAYIR